MNTRLFVFRTADFCCSVRHRCLIGCYSHTLFVLMKLACKPWHLILEQNNIVRKSHLFSRKLILLTCHYEKQLSQSGASLWGPLKELWDTVDGALLKKHPESIHLLDLQLKKHKADFLSLFKNPVRFCSLCVSTSCQLWCAFLYTVLILTILFFFIL